MAAAAARRGSSLDGTRSRSPAGGRERYHVLCAIAWESYVAFP
jgi:hypothetical protein